MLFIKTATFDNYMSIRVGVRLVLYNALSKTLVKFIKLELPLKFHYENEKSEFEFYKNERRCFTEGYLNLICLLRRFFEDHFGNVFSKNQKLILIF